MEFTDHDFEPHYETCPHFFRKWTQDCNCKMQWRTIQKWFDRATKAEERLREIQETTEGKDAEKLVIKVKLFECNQEYDRIRWSTYLNDKSRKKYLMDEITELENELIRRFR
jgi:hypothetical protein